MQSDSKARDYKIAKIFHWTAGALIAFNLLSGWQLDSFPDLQKETLVAIHAGVGVLIFFVMLARWWWRSSRRLYVPPGWWKKPARLLQWTFYPLVIVQALLGFSHTLFISYDVSAFGLIPVSALAPANEQLHSLLFGLHSLTATILLVLAGLHIADRTLQQE